MKKYIQVLAIILLASIDIKAQEKTTKEKNGDEFYFVYLYKKAIDEYKNASYLTSHGQRQLAKSYQKTGAFDLAENEYKKLIVRTEGKRAEDFYDYAMVLKSNGKYLESNIEMENFSTLIPKDLRVIDYNKNKTKLNQLLTDKGESKVKNLFFNSSAQDFGTTLFKDKIVFTSSRSSQLAPRKSNINGLPFLNIYISEVKNGETQTPIEFDPSINSNMNDGPVSFNQDGTLMAYTQNNNNLAKSERIVNLQLIFRSFKDGIWSANMPFILNNKDYSVGHAALSSDGNTMYFASDMPGGYGGSDIYRIKKESNGQWNKAENLGININTEGDETFPYFDENSGSILFTSNGRFGLGGFDIFVSKINSNGFQTAINAGAPLNSQYDDFAAILDAKTKKYYFSSNRPSGKGNDDIYTMDLVETKKIDEVVKGVETISHTKTENKIEVGDDSSLLLNFVKIYFDLDKYAIRPDAIPLLNNIISTMNIYPTIIVGLRAHTDCRNTNTYNQLLSNKRAQSTINYIKGKITNPNRIYGQGYGESRLINECTCDINENFCSEESHQKNRRVEFFISELQLSSSIILKN